MINYEPKFWNKHNSEDRSSDAALCSDGSATCVFAGYHEPRFLPRVLWEGKYYRSGQPLTLEDPYQAEVDLTANTLIDDKVILMALIRDDRNAVGTFGPVSYFDNRSVFWQWQEFSQSDSLFTTLVQWGDPRVAAQNADLTSFDPLTTLTNLQKNGMALSLQGQILRKGGFARLFSIQSFSAELNQNPEKMTAYFYNRTIEMIEVTDS